MLFVGDGSGLERNVLTLVAINVFPSLLAYAAAKDLFSMKIPNWISLGLVGWFFVLSFASGTEMVVLFSHIGAALLALVVAFLFFCFGWIGGGDAKLTASIALWLGLNPILFEYWLLSSALGGGLTLAILLFRRFPLFLPPWDWILRLHDNKNGVPYGIALSAAGLLVYPRMDLFNILNNI